MIGFRSWPGAEVIVDDVSIREIKASNTTEIKKMKTGFPDWSNPTFELRSAENLGAMGKQFTTDQWRGAENFSAAACLGWNEQGLRLAVKVKDSDRQQPYTDDAMWQGDSIQIGIDAGADARKRPFGSGFDDANDFLYGLSLPEKPGNEPQFYRWVAPEGKPTGLIPNDGKSHQFKLDTEGNEALYDAFISWQELGIAPEAGQVLGFNLVVFDLFKKEDANALIWMQLTPGIAGSQGPSPALWRQFVLAN